MYKIINIVLGFLVIFYWIIDVILQAKGMVKDVNGVDPQNDMNALFSSEDI